jgi:hypothetical protein
MTRLDETMLDATTRALPEQDSAPRAGRVLREYQENARAMAVAVLAALGGTMESLGLAFILYEPPPEYALRSCWHAS